MLALAALLAFAPAVAEARMGGGGSFGSRGSRSFSPPPATRTMPGQASPFERSTTPQPSPGMAARPGWNGAFGGGFGRGLLGGLAGGLLGAGLFGLLTGNGLFGGIGGFMSIIGLLLQIALVVFLARLAFTWWANRNAAVAGAGGRPGAHPGASAFTGGSVFGGAPGFGSGAGAQGARSTPLKLATEDFSAFERLLDETQAAYSREDAAGLRRLTTPEMASYFDEELEANKRKGVVNRISDVKLLQGDLSEAWREGADEYATVAMRFSLNDVYEDRVTGKPVSGADAPTQATEAWTFRRPTGAGAQEWKLSAIQQAA